MLESANLVPGWQGAARAEQGGHDGSLRGDSLRASCRRDRCRWASGRGGRGGNGLLIPPAQMGAPTDARMRERLGKRAQARVQGLASEGIVAECWSTIHSEHELELLRCA